MTGPMRVQMVDDLHARSVAKAGGNPRFGGAGSVVLMIHGPVSFDRARQVRPVSRTRRTPQGRSRSPRPSARRRTLPRSTYTRRGRLSPSAARTPGSKSPQTLTSTATSPRSGGSSGSMWSFRTRKPSFASPESFPDPSPERRQPPPKPTDAQTWRTRRRRRPGRRRHFVAFTGNWAAPGH